MRALCVAVLTVQLSTDFGTSEIHCLENQVLNSTKYNVSKSVLLSTDFSCLLVLNEGEKTHLVDPLSKGEKKREF